MTRIAIRGIVGDRKLFEDLVELHDDEDMEELLPSLAEKHATAMANHELHMIEIEFLDEPNVNERFFRFGTDPRYMVQPLRIDL